VSENQEKVNVKLKNTPSGLTRQILSKRHFVTAYLVSKMPKNHTSESYQPDIHFISQFGFKSSTQIFIKSKHYWIIHK
jgi:hypothetical protein